MAVTVPHRVRKCCSGNIDTILGTINSAGGNQGGDINITGPGNINTGTIGSISALLSNGFNENSGNISIESFTGNINTSSGPLITASARGRGGNITVKADVGSITVGQLIAKSFISTGGKINLTAGNNITTTGKIETNKNSINFNNPLTIAENVTFTNAGAGKITFNGTVNGTQNLILDTGNGTVQFNDVVGSIAPLNNLVVHGNITTTNPKGVDIRAVNNITTGNITSGGGIALFSSNRHISAGVLNSSSVGNAGDVTLNAPGNISVSQINAQSRNGTGGNVNVTTNSFVQVKGSFIDQNGVIASISNAGAVDGGKITITHGGGGLTPFIVGNPDTNGTQGAITRGDGAPEQTISPTQEHRYTHKQDADRIQIISVNPITSPPLPDPNPLPPDISSKLSSTQNSVPNTNPTEDLALLIGDILGVKTQINRDPQTGDYKFVWLLSEGRDLWADAPSNFYRTETDPRKNPNIVSEIDESFQNQFEEYFGEKLTKKKVTTENIRSTLKAVEKQTGQLAVVVYVRFVPSQSGGSQSSNQLQLVLVVSSGSPIVKTIPNADRETVEYELDKFVQNLNDYTTSSYLPSAQKFYKWLIAPIASDLKALKVNTLIFSIDISENSKSLLDTAFFLSWRGL